MGLFHDIHDVLLIGFDAALSEVGGPLLVSLLQVAPKEFVDAALKVLGVVLAGLHEYLEVLGIVHCALLDPHRVAQLLLAPQLVKRRLVDQRADDVLNCLDIWILRLRKLEENTNAVVLALCKQVLVDSIVDRLRLKEARLVQLWLS